MTQLQSPQVLTDLYRDLRDRRLLPLVVVLLVGLAVVPIALSSEAKEVPPASPAALPVAKNTDTPAKEVALANPGVRDYERRLKGRTSKDPFIQLFRNSGTFEASGDASGAEGASSVEPLGGSTVTAPAPSGGAGGNGGAIPQLQTETKFYSYQVKMRTGQPGDMKVRENVSRLTPLPSKAVPAALFLGVTTDKDFQPKAAVFIVSSAVSSATGEGACTNVGTQCQILALKPGEYEDFVWADGLVYRVELVNFNLITRNELPGVEDDGSKGDGGRGSGPGSTGRGARHYFSF